MSIPESNRLTQLKAKGFYELNRDELTEFVDLSNKELDMTEHGEGVATAAIQQTLMIARERLEKNWV